MRLPSLSPPRRSASLLGLDLSPGHARLMACTRTRLGWRVERCGERELAAGSLQDGQLQQFDAVCKVLRELVHQADAGSRVALALPQELARRQVLLVPAMRPWQWRGWLQAQAEQLAGAPAHTQAVDVQLLLVRPLTVLLSVCPRETLEDWQGLAEAAGLQLALVDDRLRVMRLALDVLGLASGADVDCALAEAEVDRCEVHVWRPGQAVQSRQLSSWGAAAAGPVPAEGGGWLVATASDAALWSAQLQADAPGRWSRPGLRARLEWAEAFPPPDDADCYLAAFGLALRAWH